MEKPCIKCIERDFCKGELPCQKMKAYERWKEKCIEIRKHTLEVMERAKKKGISNEQSDPNGTVSEKS